MSPRLPHIRARAALLGLLLAAALAPTPGAAIQQDSPPEPGSTLRVFLLTIGPGEAVWERFGHNALRVLDTSTGEDVSYNWGIFDFDQVDFIPRFLKGEMLYTMAPYPTGPLVDAYAGTGRRMVMQELALTPAQRQAVQEYVTWNALPENRDYRYQYFRDNCSTRVRDVLDRAMAGALQARFGDAPTGTSFRDQIRRLTRNDPLLFTGMDVLLGAPGDEPISVWEEMFLPMSLRDALRDVTVKGPDGAERPLVVSEEVVLAGLTAEEPAAPPSWVPAFLVLGILLGGALTLLGHRAHAGAAWAKVGLVVLGGGWSLVAGLVGTILALVYLTDHTFMFRNQNLFLANPLSLALAVMVPLSVWKPYYRLAATAVAMLVAASALAGILADGVSDWTHHNGLFVALALPVHLGLWGSLRALAGTRALSVAEEMSERGRWLRLRR